MEGTPLRVVVQRQTLGFDWMTAAAWSILQTPFLIFISFKSKLFFFFFPAPYLTKTEQRKQEVSCSWTVALSQTGRLIGTEWRVLARSLHAGVTLWEEEEEERRRGRGRGRGRERLFGILIRQQDTVGTVHICEELNVVMKDVLLHPVTLMLFYYLQFMTIKF